MKPQNRLKELSRNERKIYLLALEDVKEINEKLHGKLDLIEDYIKDLYEKTAYQINISGHISDIKQLIKQSKELLKDWRLKNETNKIIN